MQLEAIASCPIASYLGEGEEVTIVLTCNVSGIGMLPTSVLQLFCCYQDDEVL